MYECDFVTCWSRRWVSALTNPFPAGDFKIGGYTAMSFPAGDFKIGGYTAMSLRVNSPVYKKCRNKIEHSYSNQYYITFIFNLQ